MTEQLVIRSLEHIVHDNSRLIREWAANLSTAVDPLYELSWSGNFYLQAAELKFAKEALAFLKGEVNPDFAGDRMRCIREEWTRDVMQMAETIPSSTSKVSNLAEEAKRSGKARLLRTYFR